MSEWKQQIDISHVVFCHSTLDANVDVLCTFVGGEYVAYCVQHDVVVKADTHSAAIQAMEYALDQAICKHDDPIKPSYWMMDEAYNMIRGAKNWLNGVIRHLRSTNTLK